jgi:hypothetical protein
MVGRTRRVEQRYSRFLTTIGESARVTAKPSAKGIINAQAKQFARSEVASSALRARAPRSRSRKKSRAGFSPCPATIVSVCETRSLLLLTSELPAQSLHAGQGQAKKSDGGATIWHSTGAGSEGKYRLLLSASVAHVEIPGTVCRVGA